MLILIKMISSKSLHTWRIQSEYLMISSLPGKASRMLVELRGLPSDSTCILEAKPGKLDIKDTNLVFDLSIYPLFHSSKW